MSLCHPASSTHCPSSAFVPIKYCCRSVRRTTACAMGLHVRPRSSAIPASCSIQPLLSAGGHALGVVSPARRRVERYPSVVDYRGRGQCADERLCLFAVYAAVAAQRKTPLVFPSTWATWQDEKHHATTRLRGYLSVERRTRTP